MKSIRSPAMLKEQRSSDFDYRRTQSIANWSFALSIIAIGAAIFQSTIFAWHANDPIKQANFSYQLTFCERVSRQLGEAMISASNFADLRVKYKIEKRDESGLRDSPEGQRWSDNLMVLGQTQTEWRSLFGNTDTFAKAVDNIQQFTMAGGFGPAYEYQQSAVFDCYQNIREGKAL